jgi:hypothetical protein
VLVINIPKPEIENRRLHGTYDARSQNVINLVLGVLGDPVSYFVSAAR